MTKFFASALLPLILATPLAAGSSKAAPKPVPSAPETAANASKEKKSDGAKAHAIELTVSKFDVEGKSQRFVSSKEPVKVGAAKLVNPSEDLAGGAVAVDVQAGTKDGEPVWIRLAIARSDLKKLGSILKSDDFETLLMQIGNRVDQSCSAAPRECCAKGEDGNCTRVCCGK